MDIQPRGFCERYSDSKGDERFFDKYICRRASRKMCKRCVLLVSPRVTDATDMCETAVRFNRSRMIRFLSVLVLAVQLSIRRFLFLFDLLELLN